MGAGALLLVVLAAATVFASESVHPPSRLPLPRLFLQTDHLWLPGPGEPAEATADQQVFQLDASLIAGLPAPDLAPADHSRIAIAAAPDLAALRIQTDGVVTPYLGAGVSAVPEVAETPGISGYEAKREADLQAYQLGAGLDCDLSRSARLNLGYRYSAGNLAELAGIKPDYVEPVEDRHHLSVGLKLDF